MTLDHTFDGAHWIWCGDTTEDFHVRAWARKTFSWDGRGQVRLQITADLRYMAWVNGRRLGFGPPKFHADTPTVDEYEISGLLRPGSNLVAVQVYSLGNRRISSCMPRRGGLRTQLSGDGWRLGTDSTWKMRSDPGFLSDTAPRGEMQPPCEWYDARLGIGQPESEDYDDSAWPFAHEWSAREDLVLEPRDIPFMTTQPFRPDRLIECGVATFSKANPHFPELASELAKARTQPDRENRIQPSVTKTTGVAFDTKGLSASETLYGLWDFGRIWTGYPCLQVRGTPGTIIDISYSEDLKDHRIRPNKSLPYHDRIVLGDEPLFHRITWPKSLRYFQANVSNGHVVIEDLFLERSTYPVHRRGFFSCDDPVLNQAVEISLHTVQLGMEDSFMDTPWRERGSWLGDDLIKAQTASDYFQDQRLARRFLLHHARGQRTNGMMSGKYPGNVTSEVSTWTLRFPPSVLEYCAASGDWDFGHELWPVLERLWRWLETCSTEDGLYQAPPVHVDAHTNRYNFIDWAPIEMRGKNAAWNAFAHACLRAIGTIAGETGREPEAASLDRRLAQHHQAFIRNFWDNRRGVFVNGQIDGRRTERWGCHENVLALLFELAEPDHSESIVRNLREQDLFAIFSARDEDYEEELPGLGKIPTVSLALSKYRWPDSCMVPLGTAYFAGYLIEALCALGMVNEARSLINQRWGEFSRQGATTVWETWNMDQSLSHGWSASPAVFASRHLLGVQRADSTGIRYYILPRVQDFTILRGRVATRVGVVQVEWKENALNIDVPAGLSWFAGLPLKNGFQLNLNGVPVTSSFTVQRDGCDFGLVELQPGSHRLEG